MLLMKSYEATLDSVSIDIFVYKRILKELEIEPIELHVNYM